MEQGFFDALSRAGVSPSSYGLLKLDGKLRRYNVQGDRKGRRNGWYRYVRVSDEYAFAVFGSHKHGVNEKWTSKSRASVTSYEVKAERKIQRDIDKGAEELKVRVAAKAARCWTWLATPTEHPYAARKGVGLYGVRQLNNALVVPLYSDNMIVNLQFIYPEGAKRFLEGGMKKGCWYWLGEETDVANDTIYLAEGYSTAASVYEATGVFTVIAFDAGNIPPVVTALRTRWPEKRIVIAADSDIWTPGNPGHSKAQEAAAMYPNIEIRLPPFAYEDAARPTDWNDYHARFGLEKLRQELAGLREKPAASLALAGDKWKSCLLAGKRVEPGYRDYDDKSKENCFLFMENHEQFKDILTYNVFTDSIYLVRCPPWEDAEKFMPRELNETDAAMYVRSLERAGIRTTCDVVRDYMIKLAADRLINPPLDYFERIVWDGRARLNGWLTYYLGAEKQAPEYLALVGSKWMIGAVSRVYRPGCKFDNVLILEGKQDIKKSTVFETLATFHGETYFLEFSGDVTVKDSLIEMHGNLIVELSELASMGKVDSNVLKSFITKKIDKYRPPYGRVMRKRPRYFVFGATTNNDGADAYLIDPTGGRRYWPVGCRSIDIEALADDREQLWAEAVARYKAGEKSWLEDEEKEFALIEQENRKYKDSWCQPIATGLYMLAETTVYDTCKVLNLSADQINPRNEKRVARCLAELGWEPTENRKQSDRGRGRVWRKNHATD